MRSNLPRRTHLRPRTRINTLRRTLLVTSGFFAVAAIAVFAYIQFTGFEYAKAKSEELPLPELKQPEREVMKAVAENSLLYNQPVMLAYFRTVINPITVELLWSCAAENNNSRFIIEKSVNGGIFREVGIVNSTGGRDQSSDYSFTDNAPGMGVMMYRLRQVSRNGSSSLIAIEKATRNNKYKDKPLYIENIGPENFDNYFNINYYSANGGGVCIEIFDETGVNVFKSYTNSKKGYNTCRFIDAGMLKKREYTLRIANTSAAFVKRIKRDYVPA